MNRHITIRRSRIDCRQPWTVTIFTPARIFTARFSTFDDAIEDAREQLAAWRRLRRRLGEPSVRADVVVGLTTSGSRFLLEDVVR